MLDPLELIDGIGVARVPLLPLRVGESLLAADEPLRLLRELLATRSDCRLAIFVASPTLYRGMQDWLGGRPLKNAKTPLKLLAYAVRMSMRTTPFGMFAAIGAVEDGPLQTLRIGAGARTCRFRPDAAWLLAETGAIEDDPLRRDRLQVVASDAVREHGGRLYITNYAVRQTTPGGTIQLGSPMSLRRTTGVDAALRTSRDGIAYGELVARLAEEFAVREAIARRLVDDLWRAGALVPEMRPPPVNAALDHIIEHLPGEEGALQTRLIEHRTRLERLSTAPGALGENDVIAAVAALRNEHPELNDVVHVDTAIALEGTLARRVLEDAAVLAAVQLRGGRAMQLRVLEEAWRRRFDTPGVLVPLLDILDPDVGLGDPGTLEPAPIVAAEGDAVRVAAAAEALVLGRDELELNGDDLARWFPPPKKTANYPDAIEVGFTLLAASAAAVDAGAYQICATPLCVSGAGRSLGRFADILPATTLERLRAAAASVGDDAIHAELICVAPWPRAANIQTRPLLYAHHIDLGVHVTAGERISTRDLFVGLDERGFYLFSRRHQQRVVVHESHLMTTPAIAPAVCRFLALIARAQVAPGGVEWGAAEHFPALPRLRFGRVVLSPRRWRLPGHLFAGTAEAAVAAIRAWRARWMCPAHVRIGSGDTLLAVNLDVPEFVALIQDQRRSRSDAPVDVREILETSQPSVVHGADGAYAAEFVASFRVRPHDGPAPVRPSEEPRVFGAPPLHGLASDYVYVKLYCAAHQMDRMLANEIAPAAERLLAAGLADRWFFIRYADPEPHLRLRLHAVDGAADALRASLFAAMDEWLRAKLCYRVSADTYAPEVARYGGLAALPLVEEIFMQSSRACSTALSPPPSDLRDRIRRATMTAHERFAPLVERLGMRWWLERVTHERPPHGADFRNDLTIVTAAFGDTLAAHARDAAANALVDLSETGAFATPLADVVSALLHMHVNRFGIEPNDEPVVRELIAQTYRSSIARKRPPADAER